MKHVYEDHGSNCDSPGNCMFCDGGLKLCIVCWLAEGSLTTDCPGYKVDDKIADVVYSGLADYIDGKWVGLDD